MIPTEQRKALRLPASGHAKPALVLAAVAAEFDFPVAVLEGRKRWTNIALARHVAAWLLRRTAGRSYPEIGHLLGGRDHTTAMHAEERVEALRAKEPEFWMLTERLRRQLVPEAPSRPEATAAE